MFKFLEGQNNFGLFVLRICLAALFLSAGIGKAIHLEGPTKMFTSLGFPMPYFFAVFVMIFEIAGGALLLLGLLTRASAIWLSIILIVAIFAVQIKTLGTAQGMGFFKDLGLLGGTLALIFLGPGRFSLDEVLLIE